MSNASTTPLLTDQALLIALANTGHDGPDELADAVAFGRWWVRLEQEPATDAEGPGLDAVRAARDLIRALTLRNNGVEADLEAGALGRLPLHLVLDGGPDLAATGVPDLGGVVAARAVAALLRTAGRPDWGRLKGCPGPDCGWVFADRSRNGSRRWCQMSECGNRAKGAAFRERNRSSS
jgi:hypothetical protein